MIYAWSPVVHFECPGTRIILALAYPSLAVLLWELVWLWMTLFKLFGKDTNLLQLFSLEINLNYCFGNVFRLLWTYLYLIVNENNFKSGNISYHPAFVAALWLNIVEKEVCTCTDYFIDGHLLHWFWKYFWLHKRSVALLIYIFKGKEQERRKKGGRGEEFWLMNQI